MKRFQLLNLILAAMMAVFLFAGQASAQLTEAQQAEIAAAAATGDPEAVEAATKAIIQAAVAAGEDPAAVAEQATSIAVTSAAGAGQDVSAVTQAASSGASSGAVAAAAAAGQDTAEIGRAHV